MSDHRDLAFVCAILHCDTLADVGEDSFDRRGDDYRRQAVRVTGDPAVLTRALVDLGREGPTSIAPPVVR